MEVSDFYHAVQSGHYHTCRQIIKYYKKRNISTQLLRTLHDESILQLLFQSITSYEIEEFIEIANELIQTDCADVNLLVNEEDDLTLLHFACDNENNLSEVVETLLENEANVNAQTSYKNKPYYTPLHFAVRRDNIQTVKLLLDHGADPNITDSFGTTPLDLALTLKKLDISRMLLTDFNVTDICGQTPLMRAVLSKDDKLFSVLIDNNADVNFHVRNGPIALEHALCNDSPKIFKTLWDLTDIKLINERLEDILDTMITCMWYKPDKISYLRKVLKAPGIILPPTYRFLHKLAIALTKMNVDYTDIILEEELTKEEFLKIDVRRIVKILLKKDYKILDEDLEGIVYLCHRYNSYNSEERELELLNLLKKKKIKINLHMIYFSVVNYPKFCTTLMKFSKRCDPIDIFKHIIKSNRVIDVEILNLIRDILTVCNPPRYLRLQCAVQIRYLFELKMCPVRRNIYVPWKLTMPVYKFIEGYEVDEHLFHEVHNQLTKNIIYSLIMTTVARCSLFEQTVRYFHALFTNIKIKIADMNKLFYCENTDDPLRKCLP